MKRLIFALPLLFSFNAFATQSIPAKRMIFGRYQSRALLQMTTSCPAPLVILVPGSGPNGPEEMAPASSTNNEQDHSIFGAFSLGLNAGGAHTLAVGKPGIEFFTNWDIKNRFYNQKLYQNLKWMDLINNVKDAVDLAKNLPCVDSKSIYILGHSEGTQVAVDYASLFPGTAKGLILIGFSGENIDTTVDWQIFRRLIDDFIAPDVDQNHDGLVSKAEAQKWPELKWNWSIGQNAITYDEIESTQRQNQSLQKIKANLLSPPLYDGVRTRAPIYMQAAFQKQDLYAFTGSIDVQTRPAEALHLLEACKITQKPNCYVQIIPGLGHAMSLPKGPRRQKLLDMTLGPVEASFIKLLSHLGKNLESK